MLIELSIGWVITLNIIAWLVIQFGLAWGFTQLAAERFDPHNFFALTKNWERDGSIYESAFGIKRWKDKLPDASRMFRGGFAKATLQRASPEFLERFLRETWRGELVHWLALLFIPVFFIWNPWWGVAVNAAAALAVNLPCILALRYNRARFLRVIQRQHANNSRPATHPKP